MVQAVPKVSIVVPVYNAGRRVETCLESIAKQTYGDFEVICIDDGSTDGSGELAEAFCSGDNRFICVHQENGGVSAARNKGLDMVRGEFVAFVDGDDLLPRKALQFMHQVSVTRDCDTIFGIYERVDGVSTYTNGRSSIVTNKARVVGPDDLDMVHCWTMCNKWFSRRIIDEHGLRLEPLSHLEDAVFVYSYLRYAQCIGTCPHIVYTYLKPLPMAGRTTTQKVNSALFANAVGALERLRGLVAGFSEELEQEFMYRSIGSPLIGDYYRRMWQLDAESADAVVAEIDRRLALLDEAHRDRALASHLDVLTLQGAVPQRELLAHPLVTVVVGAGVGSGYIAAFLEGLYDQALPSFAVRVSSQLAGSVPDEYTQMLNFAWWEGEGADNALHICTSPYFAFVDCPMLYDNRSLLAMVKRLERDPGLDFVALQPKDLHGVSAYPNEVVKYSYEHDATDLDGFWANKLFRRSSLEDRSLEMGDLFDSLAYERLTRPAMVSYVPQGEFGVMPADAEQAMSDDSGVDNAAGVVQDAADDGKQDRQGMKADAGIFARLRHGLGGLFGSGRVQHVQGAAGAQSGSVRGQALPVASKKRPAKRAVDFYLDEDVDPGLVVLEGLGKRLKGNMLYVLRELQKPEYAHVRVAFSVKETTREEVQAAFEREGLERVECVVAGTAAYKKALFSAGFLFNEVDFPNWWMKKPGQVYVNTWHGTPLKGLGKTKKGYIHGANPPRNFTMADYLLFANDFTREHLLADCGVDTLAKGTALMVGYPRTGQLFDAAMRERIRREGGMDGMRVAAWMPTWRVGGLDTQVSAFLAEMDSVLPDNMLFFVNLHHRVHGQIDFSGFKRVKPFPAGYDMYEFLCAADVLVTDYSSVLFDFAVTGRKAVLHVPDLDEYTNQRGMYFDLRELPFPLTAHVTDLVTEIQSPRQYDDTAFLRKFCRYDSARNAELLCKAVLLGDVQVPAVRINEDPAPRLFVVHDSLADGPALDMILQLQDKGFFERGAVLSFLEQRVNENGKTAYPLVRQVPIFSTKGKPLSERTEQQRLYGDLNMSGVVVVDTDSVSRVRCFARFDVPVYLFVQRTLAEMIADRDEKALKAMRLFRRWGNGIFAMDAGIAELVEGELEVPVELIATADQFMERFEGAR